MPPSLASSLKRPFLALAVVALLMQWSFSLSHRAGAQQAGPSGDEVNVPEAETPPTTATPGADKEKQQSLSLLNLYFQGGIFIYPITLLSIIGVIATIERSIALRRKKVVPDELIRALGQLATSPGGFDPRKAFRLCQQFPSAAATVVRTLLLRIGRPVAEIETAVQQTADREATRMYQNVRWLNLASTTGTLLGLLGTIQGMIVVFYTTANLPPAANRVQALSDGIYIKLVTSFSGLLVAIPAVMLAHYFEGRIQRLFYRIDDVLAQVLPQLEKFDGKPRVASGDGEHRETKSSLRRSVEPIALPQPVAKGE